MTRFPTGYMTKATPDGTDVVWSSDTVTNFNLTVASIALYIMTNNTTDNLSEGSTNKYYSDALVTANATVVSKADKTNVLELDNVTVYTPTLAYHPVTKDYADNMGTNINGLVEEAAITDGDELIYYNGSSNVKIDYTDLKSAIGADLHTTSIVASTLDMSNTPGTFTIAHGLSSIPRKLTFIVDLTGNNMGTLSYGVDGVSNSTLGLNRATTSSFSLTTSFLYREVTNNGPVEHITLEVTSIDATNITITRTNLLTPAPGTDMDCVVISES